jgi:OOP family OmpA-OmpF porin
MLFRACSLPFAACLALLLSGCIGTTALTQLDQAHPLGDPFSQELYKNYSFLARSFGDVGTPTSGSPFDVEDSIHLGGTNLGVADVANAFAQKAIVAAQGDEVLPEPPPTETAATESVRLRLLRALDQGRNKSPAHAARAQADYDCWVLDARAEALRRAAQQCRRSLDDSLAVLESDLAPGPTPPPSVPPAEAPLPMAPPAQSPTPPAGNP